MTGADDARSVDDAVVVLITAPASAVEPLVRTLLDERRIACANVLPAGRSLYRWEGRVEESEEQVVLLKTTVGQRLALRRRIVELHPYEVPEVLEWEPSGGHGPYLDWLAESCRPED